MTRSKTFITILFSICFPIFVWGQGIIAPKFIDNQVFWSNDTIIFDTTLTILHNGRLNVGENTVLLFHEGFGLVCYGKLGMIGSSEEPIILSNTGGQNPGIDSSYLGSWSGISIFGDSSKVDTFKFVNFQFSNAKGTVGFGENGDGGALYLVKNNIYFIENCLFNNNFSLNSGGAIFCEKSKLHLKKCTFLSNRCLNGSGGAISLEPASRSVIEESIFISNFSGGDISGFTEETVNKAGAIEIRYPGGWLNLYNNIFANNISNSTIWSSSSKTVISGNLIVNNYGLAYFLGNTYSEDWIFNNTIMNNEGRGLNIYSKNAIIANNYLAGNIKSTMLGQPFTTDLYFYDKDPTFDNVFNNSFRSVNTSLSYINEDLWKFHDNNYIGDYYLQDTSILIGLSDNGAEYKWNLKDDSSLSAKGSVEEFILENLPEYDINGTKRMKNGSLDIGALEIDDHLKIYINENPIAILYPSVTDDLVFINKIATEFNKIAFIEIYNLSGKLLSKEYLIDGLNSISLSQFQSGLLAINIICGLEKVAFRVIKI